MNFVLGFRDNSSWFSSSAGRRWSGSGRGGGCTGSCWSHSGSGSGGGGGGDSL